MNEQQPPITLAGAVDIVERRAAYLEALVMRVARARFLQRMPMRDDAMQMELRALYEEIDTHIARIAGVVQQRDAQEHGGLIVP